MTIEIKEFIGAQNKFIKEDAEIKKPVKTKKKPAKKPAPAK